MKNDDGGRAHPSAGVYHPTHGVAPCDAFYDAGGMTLQDYFAAKAMQAAFAGDGARMVADRDGRYDETNWAEVVAKNAYEMADAMIAEKRRLEDRT